MLSKTFSSLLGAAAVALSISSLTSCVTKVPVSQAFWQDRQAKVAVAVAPAVNQGFFYKEGNQGLLDLAINSAVTAGPNRALKQVKPDSFRLLKSQFVADLKKRGHNAVEVKEDLQLKNYPKLQGGATGDAGKDYSSVLNAYGADYLVVLSLNGYGSIRPYYGFIPLGVPKGYANASGFMVKRGASKPLWHTGMGPQNQSVVPVSGNWDQGPEFKNLIEATHQALDSSRTNLKGEFFQ